MFVSKIKLQEFNSMWKKKKKNYESPMVIIKLVKSKDVRLNKKRGKNKKFKTKLRFLLASSAN